MEHYHNQTPRLSQAVGVFALYGKHFGASSGSGFCHVCRTNGKLLAGRPVCGSDGNHYRAPAPYTYLAYHADGTIDVHTSSGGNAYRHYMLTDADGISHQVYCVESGIPYHTSENTYVSESGTNSQYLNLLPAEARRGITLTAIYGWKPGAALPVSGINEDDYKMATQIILGNTSSSLEAIRTTATETATQMVTSISA